MATKKMTETDVQVVEKVTAEAREVKKEAVKKEPVKAAAKKAPKTAVSVQFAGKDLSVEDLTKRAIKEYKKLRKAVDVKTLELYINADEHRAYYVVNKESAPEFVLEL